MPILLVFVSVSCVLTSVCQQKLLLRFYLQAVSFENVAPVFDDPRVCEAQGRGGEVSRKREERGVALLWTMRGEYF